MSTYENPASGSRSMYATPISLFSRFPSYAYTLGIRRLEFAETYRIAVTVVCNIVSRNLELYCDPTYPARQSQISLSSNTASNNTFIPPQMNFFELTVQDMELRFADIIDASF